MSPRLDALRSHDVIVLDGTTFFFSDSHGDVEPGRADGYFYRDVRHLSRWQLCVDGERPVGVTAASVDYYSARIVLAPAAEDPAFSIRRERFVGEGVHEDLIVTSLEEWPCTVRLELRFEADFTDVMEVQGNGAQHNGGRRSVELEDRSVVLWCEQGAFRRGTRIAFGADCEVERHRAIFELELESRGEWRTCIDLVAIADGEEARPLLRCGSFGAPEPDMPLALEEWLAHAPQLETPDAALQCTYRQSLHDLAALRIRPGGRLDHAMAAGGVPWFMCVFGRDSILAAYEALPFEPTLAEATLQALAALQADEWDDWRDAEPGKIPHEWRHGKLVALGESPHDPYYGSHDSTMLWLILLDEYERWTGDAELVRKLEQPARRAVAWIDESADLDGDGYAEYRSRSKDGLENLCWKDSDASIAYADGRLAEPPIATCEIQGYLYDARLRTARLAREVWSDPALAERLEAEARELKTRFARDFWDDERGTFLIALAGPNMNGRVDAITSNAGQLLWSGIVDEERAERVAERLLRPDLFSGWGIRTMASEERAYNPLRYHNGTVWPHDTALILAGLRRYGFDRQAARVARALFDAAEAFDHRLPELFSGFARDETDLPIGYPNALAPQAWAAAAPLLALRTVLGLEPDGDELHAHPLDDPLTHGLELRGLQFRGRRVDVP